MSFELRMDKHVQSYMSLMFNVHAYAYVALHLISMSVPFDQKLTDSNELYDDEIIY